MRGRLRPAAMMLGILAMAGCVEPAQQAQTGSAGPFDGQFEGTGVLLSGTNCSGTIGQPFAVTMAIAGGQARMPLFRGTRALAGPVGPNGALDAIRWQGDTGAIESGGGQVTAAGFVLDYRFDWPERNAVGCHYRYEGRRLG